MEELLRIAGGITLGYAAWLAFSFIFNLLWWWHFCRSVHVKMGFLRTLVVIFVVPTIYFVLPYVALGILTALRYDNPRKWENYKYFCVLTWHGRSIANEWFEERHIQLSPRARQLIVALINKVDAAQQKVKQALAAIASYGNKNGR